jgi:hypothetical protein
VSGSASHGVAPLLKPAERSAQLMTPNRPSSSHRNTAPLTTTGTAQAIRYKLRIVRLPGNSHW